MKGRKITAADLIAQAAANGYKRRHKSNKMRPVIRKSTSRRLEEIEILY
jgi:hypothetical protein